MHTFLPFLKADQWHELLSCSPSTQPIFDSAVVPNWYLPWSGNSISNLPFSGESKDNRPDTSSYYFSSVPLPKFSPLAHSSSLGQHFSKVYSTEVW